MVEANSALIVDHPAAYNELSRPPSAISGSELDLTATDFAILAPVSANDGRLTFVGRGVVGSGLPGTSNRIDGAELDLLDINNLVFEATGTLDVGGIDLGRDAGPADNITFTAGDTVEVLGFVSGIAGNGQVLALSFGEADGVRPRGVNVRADSGGSVTGEGRIGVERVGEGSAVIRSAPEGNRVFRQWRCCL